MVLLLLLASRLGGRSGVVYIEELGNLFFAIIITTTIAIATTITTITPLAKSADRGLVLPPRAMCGFGGPHRRFCLVFFSSCFSFVFAFFFFLFLTQVSGPGPCPGSLGVTSVHLGAPRVTSQPTRLLGKRTILEK